MEQHKDLFTRRQEYINFGPDVTYHFASRTKQYVKPETFLA